MAVSDEDYEILSGLPDSVLYTCGPCAGATHPRWREALSGALQGGLRQVLQGLLSSKVAGPLLLCTQVCGAQEVGRGGATPSTSPADFLSLQCGQAGKQLHPGPCDLQAVSRRFEEGHYKSVVSGTLRRIGGCQEEGPVGRVGALILTSPLTAQLYGGHGGHPDEALGRRRDHRAPGWRPDEGAPTEGENCGGCL